jgi:hypothetical protein
LIRFLRGRSARPLLTALSIAAAIDVVALVVLTLAEAHLVPTHDRQPADGALDEDRQSGEVVLGSVADQLDTRRLGWGLGLLLAYPAAVVSLWSPAVRRHCGGRRTG